MIRVRWWRRPAFGFRRAAGWQRLGFRWAFDLGPLEVRRVTTRAEAARLRWLRGGR